MHGLYGSGSANIPAGTIKRPHSTGKKKQPKLKFSLCLGVYESTDWEPAKTGVRVVHQQLMSQRNKPNPN